MSDASTATATSRRKRIGVSSFRRARPRPSSTAAYGWKGVLDTSIAFRQPEVPKVERPCRSLCQCPPADVNRGVFAFLPSAHLMGVEYISAEQRPVSVRTGGLSTAGERCFAFFDRECSGESLRPNTPPRVPVPDLDGDSLGGILSI